MATGVYFRKLSSAELALEAIQDGKVLYNYETKKIYVDSGTPTATRYEFYDFIGINTATVYSASSTYAIGAYCIYGDLLYRCTTAITVAEAWTIGHWTQVNIMNEITSLNSSLVNGIEYSSTVTLESGVTITNASYLNSYKKKGNELKIKSVLNCTIPNSTSYTKVATLPVSIRPSTSQMCCGIVFVNNIRVPCNIRFDTDGTINVCNYTSANATASILIMDCSIQLS